MPAAASDRGNMLGWLEVSPARLVRELSGEQWRQAQLELLGRTLRHAGEHAPFYRGRLRAAADLGALPFTTAADLSRGWEGFLGVPLREVRRIVTLRTSGSTGTPKRVAFTEEDLARTVRFFQYGMQELMGPGDKAMLCLPGSRENGVVDLLSQGIRRFGGIPLAYGNIADPAEAADFVGRERPRCIVAVPGQMAAFAAYVQAGGGMADGPVRAVLLTGDYVPDAVKGRVGRAFGCRVHNHYGATEMGYGGALECRCGGGLHVRGNDLFVEVVDPATGAPLPAGAEGELVVTTLRREAMPLIRYRTGDLAAILPGGCGCGCPFIRLSSPRRMEGCRLPVDGGVLSLHALDEAVFALAGVADFEADYDRGEHSLYLRVWPVGGGLAEGPLLSGVQEAARRVVPDGMTLGCVAADAGSPRPSLLGKRALKLHGEG